MTSSSSLTSLSVYVAAITESLMTRSRGKPRAGLYDLSATTIAEQEDGRQLQISSAHFVVEQRPLDVEQRGARHSLENSAIGRADLMIWKIDCSVGPPPAAPG